ncbi:hypothetical protein HYH03_015538 [Edaphochlamys debaryana]|uniref:Nucleotide-diphospho-sugar transferase domain-containing protein n=1 Tax=Edaphochlamys debaryana TaxID=47281 RepID=A0A835XLK6_9CHLO|nr:hypothetical protein HYH03_015538 [Edaphochlamys debaryana]|eukprot:KAG2485729.1 hypothetical protein HYH03_015538 [Edaphochlamys debaryana]
MNDYSLPKCQALAQKYGSQFLRYGDSAFSLGNFDVFSAEFFGIGFVKIATILDGLTAGVDVLFLDADQVFFRNPLPYLLARETDIMVSGDCHHHRDETPEEQLPPINNNIGFVYLRHTPMVARAVMNWGYWLTDILRSGGTAWDQRTFAAAMQYVSTDVTRRHLSLAMLRPDLFPYKCMGPCGCDLRGVSYFTLGKIPQRDSAGNCPKVLMEGWYAYHMPCSGDMNNKARLMAEYSEMYQRVVGPVNSRSAPFEAL